MDIEIVLGKESDVDELELLYNDLNDALAAGINYPGWKKGVYPTRSDAEKGIAEGELYVAKYDGRIVGSVILSHEPESAYAGVSWGNEDSYDKIFVIRTFVAHPDYFGHGIGKKLLDFADQRAALENIESIRLDVYEKNMPAVKLYEKCGYKYVDTVDLGLGNYGLDWFKLYEKML